MITKLYSTFKKKRRIRKLFKKREYALLFAFYRHELPLFKEGIVLYHLKLFRLFLIEPKWRNSIFFVLGLLATGKHNEAKNKLYLLKQYSRNQLILSLFAPYFPEMVKSLCEKEGKIYSLFFAGLCANLQELSQLELTLSKLNNTKEYRNPQFFLLKNFIELDDNVKLGNLNKFLNCYDLDSVTLSQKSNSQFLHRIKNPHKLIIENSNMPLVSILITTYNTEEYIENTLHSLLEQSYPNIEIIVIDDNSIDSSCEIVKKLSEIYSNIKLIMLEHNVGTYVAKNIGITYAQGEFITCNDSDDWAHPRKIELQIKPLLDNPQLVATFSKWIRLDSEGRPYTHYIYPLLRLNPSSALFRRKEIEDNIGLWDGVRIGADSEFNARLQLAFGSDRYYIINKPLTLGAHRHNSLMTNVDTGYINGFSAQREQYSFSWNCWHINQIKQNRNLKLPDYPKRSIYS